MQIIAIATTKGGSGKTSTAAALLQAAIDTGKKALAVDLDPQANLTMALGADPNRPGAVQLLRGSPAADTIQTTQQLIATIAGHRDLAAEHTTTGSAYRLRDALAQLQGQFDLCIIDTPPTLGELVYNALNAADGLIIPVETEPASLQGLYQIADIAGQMQRTNPGLQILGTVVTRYDSRPKINRYMLDVITGAGAASGAPILGTIRNGVSIREAMAARQSLFDYAPKSKPAEDYKQLFNKITGKKPAKH